MRWVRQEISDNVLTLVLDRPESLNAFNDEMLVSLGNGLEYARQDSIRVVVLRGEGTSFCAGADVSAILGERDRDRARETLESLAGILRQIGALPKPVIAAFQGHAAGGGAELVLEADLRLAATDAQLWLPDVSVGSSPTTLWQLTRLVGRGVAAEMAMLGRRLRADELLTRGVVHEVVDPTVLAASAAELAGRLCDDFGSRSLRHAKEALRLAAEVDRETDLRMNIELMLDCFGTSEQEGAIERFTDR